MATNTSSNAQKHLAVLIDADNAPAAIVEGLFEEIAKYGVASVKRIYGDWTGPQLGGWKKVLLDHSIQPIQQFAYTKGKNATDSSLIIDAMDLLYTRRFDGFCLVSSDSDFTRLASRLREEGLTVYGFGEEKLLGLSWRRATNSSTSNYCAKMPLQLFPKSPAQTRLHPSTCRNPLQRNRPKSQRLQSVSLRRSWTTSLTRMAGCSSAR